MPRGIPNTRLIQTPGLPIFPGLVTNDDDGDQSANPAADLAEFDEPSIPEAHVPSAQELLAEVIKLRGDVATLKAKNSTPAEVSKKAGVPVVAMAQAISEAHAMVAAGQRPRAALTPEGWYCHPEAARVAGSLGNTKA